MNAEKGSMSDTAYCTIITKSYLAYARALADTIKTYDPQSTLYVLLADRIDGYFDPEKESFELITLEELSDQDTIHRMRFYYNAIEMCFTLRAWLHEYMLQKTSFQKWIYLDADIAVYHSLQKISDELDSTSILLTPHLLSTQTPLSVDEKDIIKLEASLLRSGGIYQGGFLALRRSEECRAFVQWFKDRLRLYGFNARPMQSGDQFWMTYIPLYFQNVSVLRHSGANLAYWNLYERTIEQDSSGNVLVNGEPLLFFHFAGFDVNKPDVLSKYGLPQGLKVVPGPIMETARKYSHSIIDSGYEETRKYPYAFSKFSDGHAITPMMRRLYFEEIYRGKARNGSPFEHYEYFSSRTRKAEMRAFFGRAGVSILSRFRKLLNPDFEYEVL